MLLALWPSLIARPTSVNYAFLDQQKRDRGRLERKKREIEGEREALRMRALLDDSYTAPPIEDGSTIEPAALPQNLIQVPAAAKRIAQINNASDIIAPSSIDIKERRRIKDDEALMIIIASL